MRLTFFAFTAWGLFSCADRLTPLKAEWSVTVAHASAKALEFNARYQAMAAQAQALPVLEDSTSPSAIAQREWFEDLADAEEQISDLEEAIGNAEAKVKKTISDGTLKDLQAVVVEEKKSLADEQGQAVAALEGVTGTFDAMKAGVLAQGSAEQDGAQRIPEWVRAFRRLAHQGGTQTVREVTFLKGKSELDTQSAENMKGLDALAAVFKDCKDLKVKVTGHTQQDGDAKANEKLSLGRADALKKYLTSHGAKKEALRTYGGGGNAPLVPEPAGEAEAKRMGAAAVKQAREKNRRLTLEVTSRCL
jgi:outer membrane protein OmpA-like peptidoglycan-associated protein